MRPAVFVSVLVLLTGPAARGGIRPSFTPDLCAWEASHVAVVSEGDAIDGVVRVLESWKGDLKPGDTLAVPELAAFAPPAARAVSPGAWDRNPAPRPPVSGSRMVLFLVRSAPAVGPPGWLPANTLWKRFDVSVAWVEAGRVFAFVQQANPGPSELVRAELDERALRNRVNAVVAAQAVSARAAERQPEPGLTAAVLKTLTFDSPYAHHRLFQSLAGLGWLGTQPLRAVLADEHLLRHHAAAVDALARAWGSDAGPDLAAVLGREVTFWRAAGPELKDGAWNASRVERGEAERLRHHYDRALAAVRGLKAVGFPGGRAAAAEFRDLWRSLPQLKKFGQIAVECDAYLAGD